MANVGGLITKSVSIADVASVLGFNSGDLGTLISCAKSGGRQITVGSRIFNTAYDIKELESGGSGVLLSGAMPYHNIYSKGPTHWELTQKTSTSGEDLMVMEVFNRINSSSYTTSQRYGFNLADFDGYNHNAVAPSLSLENPISLGYLDSKPATASMRMLLNSGVIDWVKMMLDSGMSSITRPYAGIYKVIRPGYGNIALQNEGESATADLSGNGEANIAARISTSSFTAAGTYTLSVELKIGNTEALNSPFRIDRWFTANIPVSVKSRPSVSQGITTYIGGYESDDATDLMKRNVAISLYQTAGGRWSGTDSYTNVKISVSGEVMTLHNSATVSWYVTRGYYGDQADIIANGKLMKTTSYYFSSYNSWTSIGINDFNLGEWVIYDSIRLYVHAIITSYSG